MDQDLKVGLILTAQDQGAKATVQSVAGSVDGLSASLDRNAASAQRTRGSNDQLAASFAASQKTLKDYDAAIAGPAKSLGELATKQAAVQAAYRSGVVTLSEYTTASGKLEQQGARLFSQFAKTAPALGAIGTAAAGATVSIAGLQREAGVLAGELLRGNTAAFEKSLVTLARQGGILQLAFSGTGAAIAGLLAIVGGSVALLAHAEAETSGYARAIELTGNFANTSSTQLRGYTAELAATNGQYDATRDALVAVTASGKIASESLESAAAGVVAYADLTGKSIESAAAAFITLQDKPYESAIKLNEALHVLSVAQAEEIRNLEETGKTAEAAAVATADFADALTDRDAKYRASLTGIAGAWRDVKGAIESATAAAGDFLSRMIDAAKNKLVQAFEKGGIAGGVATLAALSAPGVLPALGTSAPGHDWSNVKNQNDDQIASEQKVADAINNTVASMAKETTALEKKAETLGGTQRAIVDQEVKERLLAASTAEEAAAVLEEGDRQYAAADKIDTATAAKKRHVDVNKIENQTLAALHAEVERGEAIEAAYADEIGGPVVAATRKANAEQDALRLTVNALGAEFALGKISAEDFAKGIANAAKTSQQIAAGLELVKAKQAALADVQDQSGNAMDRLNAKWGQELIAIGQGTDAYDLAATKIKFETEALAAYKSAVDNAHSPEELAQVVASRDAFLAHADAVAADTVEAKKNAEQWKAWQQIGLSAGDTLASGIGDAGAKMIFEFHSIGDTFKSLGDTLKQTAEQVVSGIIQQFVKLAVINPILNAIFGGTGGWTQLAELGVSAIAGGGGSSASMSGGGGIGNDNGSAGGFGGALGNIYQYGSAAWKGYSWLTGAGGGSAIGQAGAANQSLGGSMFGTGDFDAGWGNSLSAGGGVGGALGTAGGVFGGYYLGSKYGGTAGGVAGAVGLGVAAYFVPIIGWIAGAISIIDALSGGKLLGTDGKVIGGASTLSVGPGGASVASHYTTKGQHALFGGSYYKEHAIDDPAADAAAQAFYDAMKSGADQFAKEFGLKAADVASGTFEQTFDKKGNITGSTTTIAGHTYSGESADDFGTRVTAETEIGVLSQFDSQLSTAIDKYRVNANDLLGIVNDLAAAQLAINNGEHFLALGQDQSISKLLEFAAANQRFGESVDQTLQRIMQAQAQYDQFVGQFKPPTTYADAFQEALANIGAEYKQNVKTANDLARAAGAAGASQEDLANIQKHATAELAAAIQQLKDASQQLAISLGYTTQGMTVDQIDQQIADIRNGSGSASDNLGSFGQAITDVAQRASDAYNLLLGDLSPLTDTAKLQAALAGLRQGLVTQEQVLTIGRQLYGSSQPYTDLFHEVQRYPGSAGSRVGGTAGGGTGKHPLTADEQAQISKLEQEKKDAESAQRHNEALQLARNIAELSVVTGQSYEDVAKSEGFNLDKLMGDLGVKSSADLHKMLDGFRTQQDSAHQDSQDLLDAIMQLPAAIADALNGGPGLISIHHPDQSTGTLPSGRTGNGSRGGGHSGHGRGGGVDQTDGAAMAQGFLSVIDTRAAQSDRRNGRTPFQPPQR